MGFTTTGADLAIEDLGSSDDEAPIIRLLNSLLERAIKTNASDIHIEPFENETRVRMRIDGVIMEYLPFREISMRPSLPGLRFWRTWISPRSGFPRTAISG